MCLFLFRFVGFVVASTLLGLGAVYLHRYEDRSDLDRVSFWLMSRREAFTAIGSGMLVVLLLTIVCEVGMASRRRRRRGVRDRYMRLLQREIESGTFPPTPRD